MNEPAYRSSDIGEVSWQTMLTADKSRQRYRQQATNVLRLAGRRRGAIGLAALALTVGLASPSHEVANPTADRAERPVLADDVAILPPGLQPLPTKKQQPIPRVSAHLAGRNKPTVLRPHPVQTTTKKVLPPLHLKAAIPNVPGPKQSSLRAAPVARRDGADVSFPKNNCDNAPVTLPGAAFAIIGVNHGHPFSVNNCLAQEAALGKNLAFYANTDRPADSVVQPYATKGPQKCAPTDQQCASYNYGYRAGQAVMAELAKQGLEGRVWLDVETGNKWQKSTDRPNYAQLNYASIAGETDAITTINRQRGVTQAVGYYSTRHQWTKITGGITNGAPDWIAGGLSAEQAPTLCDDHGFTGGPTEMVQYITQNPALDNDYKC